MLGNINRCFLCDSSKSLDSSTGSCVDICPTNYYPTKLISTIPVPIANPGYVLCQICNRALDYYVNINYDCIISLCPNGFRENVETCDDGNALDGGILLVVF